MTDITKELAEALEQIVQLKVPVMDLPGALTVSHLKKIAQAALASYRSQAEGDGWLPIETAPKDGTDIMLSNGTAVGEGHWLYEEGGTIEHRDLDGRYIGQDDREGFEGWIDWSGGMIPEPTHWRPLHAAPSLPSPNGEKQGAPLSNPRSQT